MPSPRRFPPPWSVEELDTCFVDGACTIAVARESADNKRGSPRRLASMTALAVLPPQRLVWIRRGIIAIGCALILTFHHQITDALVSCLRPFSPNPIVCSPPEATLPDNKDDPDSPDYRSITPQIAIVLSATSATPCSGGRRRAQQPTLTPLAPIYFDGRARPALIATRLSGDGKVGADRLRAPHPQTNLVSISPDRSAARRRRRPPRSASGRVSQGKCGRRLRCGCCSASRGRARCRGS
jgi:hypothetical protein